MAELSPFEDHLTAPRGLGRTGDDWHSGAAGGAPCGDIVRVGLLLEEGRVRAAGFEASGCGAAHAAGSAVVELVEAEPLAEVARITADRISRALGGLSPGKLHAAALAADALHRALGGAARDGAARLAPHSDRTLVAMSGGVDSAVAARLAADRGDEVVGVTLELWSDSAGDGNASCCSPEAVVGARALAHRMGLPHFTLDLREAFRGGVVDDFVREHAAGRTPNPCVRCNGLVRFDALLALAADLGAARLATGHYARVGHDGRGPLVRAAADARKDQSYMLARLEPSQLERLWFPLGELEKPEVRELARSAGLPVADKAESQDLCFLAGVGRRDFLGRGGGDGGEIVSLEGKVLGHHGGQEEFTVGQRRGIGVAAPEPLYVIEKDASRGEVVVGPRAALAARRVTLGTARLHREGGAVDAVKLRYRSSPVACRVEGAAARGPHRDLVLDLEDPVDGVAPGQTACLMRGDCIVGWGTIAVAQAASGGAHPRAGRSARPAAASVGTGE